MWVIRGRMRQIQGTFVYDVGYYSPDGDWYTHTTFNEKRKAEALCHYLNGGSQ